MDSTPGARGLPSRERLQGSADVADDDGSDHGQYATSSHKRPQPSSPSAPSETSSSKRLKLKGTVLTPTGLSSPALASAATSATTTASGSIPAGSSTVPTSSALDPFLNMPMSTVFSNLLEHMDRFQTYNEAHGAISTVLAQHDIQPPVERTPWAMILQLSNKLHMSTREVAELRRAAAQSDVARDAADARCSEQRTQLQDLGSTTARQQKMIDQLEGRLRQATTDNQAFVRNIREARASHQRALQDLTAERQEHEKTRSMVVQLREFVAYALGTFAIPLKVDIKRLLGRTQASTA